MKESSRTRQRADSARRGTRRLALSQLIDAGGASGPAYEQAFRKRYQALVAPLPWEVTQDGIKAGYGFSRLNSRAATLGNVQSNLDPAVAKSGGLDAPQAWALVAARNNLKSGLPLGLARSEVLRWTPVNLLKSPSFSF